MGDGDAELAGRAGGGDMGALEALYRRHVERVWRYAWFRTHDREAAAEIVQETFVRLLRSVRQFQGRSLFTTWLFTLVRSVAIEYARRESAERRVRSPHATVQVAGATLGAGGLRLVRPEDDPGLPRHSPAEHADRLATEEASEAVRRAVADLPAAQRDCVVLCELSGLSIREAAETLGWGESRVKVTLFRARHRLREMLREHGPAAGEEGNEATGQKARSGRPPSRPTWGRVGHPFNSPS